MSEAKPGPAAGRRRRDEWGMRPVRRGWLRGRIRNVRRRMDLSLQGHPVIVYEFDLHPGGDQPPIPVRMTGTDFQGEPAEGQLVQMADPAPEIRPLEPVRLKRPPHYRENDVAVSLYPGRDDPPMARQRVNGFLLILAPIVVATVAIGTFLAIFG